MQPAAAGSAPGRWADELRELSGEARGIGRDAGQVARDEVALALAEVKDGTRAAIQASVWGVLAAAFGVVSLAWLPLPLFLALNQNLTDWVAGLITVGALLVVAAVLGLIARARFKSVSVVPRAAIERAKEDRQWLSQQLFGKHG
jgi:hypothetical protein